MIGDIHIALMVEAIFLMGRPSQIFYAIVVSAMVWEMASFHPIRL